MQENEDYYDDFLDDEEIAIRKFEDKITFVESLISITHGDKRVTPAAMMIALMDDVNIRKYAIFITGCETWERFVRRCITHYGLRNGTWVEHLRKWNCRNRAKTHRW